jgi:hypothetical protein
MATAIYKPDSIPGPEMARLAPSPKSLAGLRIAVLDNGKPNAGVVMTRAAETLAARVGATITLITKKGAAGGVGERGDPVRPGDLRSPGSRSGSRADGGGGLRELHGLLGRGCDRAREGGDSGGRRHDDEVQADRGDVVGAVWVEGDEVARVAASDRGDGEGDVV